MKCFRYIAILLIMMSLRAMPCEAAGKVVIVSLNRTGLGQVAGDAALGPWLTRGALALVNVSTAARPVSEHVYVTLGAGSRAAGTEYTRLAFNREEEYAGAEAWEQFLRHQGSTPSGLVLQLAAAATIRANSMLRHPVAPGLLGDTLREGKKVTAVLGNADGAGYFREAVAMLADSSGQVALGDVSRSLLQNDSLFPYGLRINREEMWGAFSALYEEADVILLDWGDTVRLDDYRPLLSDNAYNELQAKIFGDAAWFLERAKEHAAPGDLLVMLSPSPRTGESGAGLLSYIVVIGEEYPAGTLLTSASTKRAGIVTAGDVAPLVLDHNGLPLPGMMLGMTMTAAEEGGTGDLLAMQRGIGRIFRLRPSLLKTYVFLQIVIVLGALLNLFVRFVRAKLFEPPLLALLLFPVVVLYLPLHSLPLVAAFFATAAALAVVVYVCTLLPGIKLRFAVIGLLTALSLALDMLRNAPLMKVSVLGYDVVSGARFYGLGNEYMGVLVGSSILGATALFSLFPGRRKWLLPVIALFFLVLVLLIVSPGGGANFGGTVTGLVAFLVTLSVLIRLRIGWRNGIILAATLALIAALAVLVNLRVSEGGQSHLGRTLFLLQGEGWQALADLVARKAAMNARLFRYSQWSRAFLVFLSMLAVLFYRPNGVLTGVHRHYNILAAGFLGIIAGSITAFILNDSGVVAAATTLLYAGVPIILLCGRVAGHNKL